MPPILKWRWPLRVTIRDDESKKIFFLTSKTRLKNRKNYFFYLSNWPMLLPLKMTTWSFWEVEFYLSKWPHWHYSYKMFVGSQSKTATLIELKLFWKWSHDLWEWPYGGPVNFCRWKDCPTSQIDHIDLVVYNKDTKCFLAPSQKRLRWLSWNFLEVITWPLRVTIRGTHQIFADKWVAQPLKLTTLTYIDHGYVD